MESDDIERLRLVRKYLLLQFQREYPGVSQSEIEAAAHYFEDLAGSPPDRIVENAFYFQESLEADDHDLGRYDVWNLTNLCSHEIERNRFESTELATRRERQRFFNRSESDADLKQWAQMATWSIDEATALSFGKDPTRVKWDRLEPFVEESAFTKEYGQRLQQVRRAVKAKLLVDPIVPVDFVTWGKQQDIDLHKLDEHVVLQQAVITGGWAFDPDSATYPEELDIAFQAWRAVTAKPIKKPPKEQIRDWLNQNYPNLSDAAKDRIATVCNWKKSGGRPK